MKITVIIALCTAALLLSGCDSARAHMRGCYAYKVLQAYNPSVLEKQLNENEPAGWRVVSCTSLKEDGTSSPAIIVILVRSRGPE